jgi:hypothetical protein
MEKLFVPYEITIELKKLGFEYTQICYKDGFNTIIVETPLYQQVIDWFKNNHKIKIREIPSTSGIDKWVIWKWNSEKALWECILSSIIDKNKAIEEVIKLISK